MFNKGNTKPMAKSVSNINSPERLNRIVEGTIIQGEVKSESNIRIDGSVKGTIITKGRLVVGPKGNIEGDVVCQNADIEGSLNGTIKVGELLSLKATSKLQGDIITSKLAIEPGAIFAGTCGMGGIVKDFNRTSSSNGAEENAPVEAEEQTA